MPQKIDFVIPWVDGGDPAWQEIRDLYINNTKGDNQNIRFRDWDNLQYWFRGIEMYTPWVNNIFFITWGHLPRWINTEHSKLKIVKHENYIPEEYLPTFNSNTIELNLHRIEGLADHFVYFNDDTFVIDSMVQEDFFKAGLPCDCAIIMPNISVFRNSTAAVVANNMEIINTTFKKKKVIRKNWWKWFNIKYKKYLISTLCSMPYKQFVGFINPHLPSSFLKDSFFEIWEKESEVLHNTCLNKFREKEDVNQWLIRYMQLVTGNFMPRKINIGMRFSLGNKNDKIAAVIKEQKYKMVCINDNDIDPILDFEKEKRIIKEAFKKILPEKSSFEL